ncbi:MAG: hypothetical protein U0031_16030 [Thermomicrobiales bacterium]
MMDRNPVDDQSEADDQFDSPETRLPVTSAADVESAGRSCMAILLLGGGIILVVVIWLLYRSFVGGS